LTRTTAAGVAALFCLAAGTVPLTAARAQDSGPTGSAPLLFQKPTVSRDRIVFAFAGDLWSVSRTGGDAIRLTSGVGVETDPQFSPDGSLIAFTGQYDGNTDVFVVPATGGIPKRLTYHPTSDVVAGWTPDGKRILFISGRESATYIPRLFTVSRDGGTASAIPLPSGMSGSYNAGATHLAYVPTLQWQAAWKRYRGGQTTPVWIADLKDSKVEKISRENSNDSTPMWVGDTVYFLSDRNGPVSLYAYDTKSKKVRSVLTNGGLDIKSASAGPGAIVYEQFGTLHLFDTATGKSTPVSINLRGDLPEVRPRYVSVGNDIQGGDLSPTGARVVVEARGEIITLPAEKGSQRILTNTPGICERQPAWSPDGKYIAYFSDESGEYALHLASQNGSSAVRKIRIGDKPTFFYGPTWSPDSKKIAFGDKQLNLWCVDVEKGTPPAKLDVNSYGGTFDGPGSLHWSPDSRFLTYSKALPSRMGAIFIYSMDEGKAHQVTDGLSDAASPQFDRSGKYLYFTASTDVAGQNTGIDMSVLVNKPVSRNVYVVVLRNDLPSPLAPESDEEKTEEKTEEKKDDASKPGDTAKPADPPKEDKKDEKKDEKDKNVRIDFEGIGQRILSLPIPTRNYGRLLAGKANILFVQETPPVVFTSINSGTPTLHRFDLATRKFEAVGPGVTGAIVSANGEKMLIQQGQRIAIVPTTGNIQPGTGTVRTSELEVYVDPRAEWRQMYNEVWRIERDWFYDPGLHGLDLNATKTKYAAYLDGLASRADLNYLFEEMLGELTVGHMFIGGGDSPSAKQVRVGLLGADYAVENGRFRISRVYSGENWNPDLRAPLTAPGVNVKAGEYLLAVNGRNVTTDKEVYSYFEATAGRQITVKVGPNPDGTGSREVTIVPIDDENGLRNRAWVEDNRRKVEQLSNGRLAYVYLPDTGLQGYTYFNRYFFSQLGREGAVIDERFNGGGLIADYIVDFLNRPLRGYFSPRDGKDFSVPGGAIFGPKAMIINEYAGSGGDAMPWLFRKAKVGPLIGKRTWGGLVGIGGYPPLMDGGSVTAPHFAFWSPETGWDVENHGVDPDIEVEMDPVLWRQGRDPQLEKAVEVVLEELKKNPVPSYQRPAYPNYHKTRAANTSGSSGAARDTTKSSTGGQ
jgi:tricorn protease